MNKLCYEIERMGCDLWQLRLLFLGELAQYKIYGSLARGMLLGNTNANARKIGPEMCHKALDAIIACI